MTEIVKETCDRWMVTGIGNIYHNRNNGKDRYTLYWNYAEITSMKMDDLIALRDLLNVVIKDEGAEE